MMPGETESMNHARVAGAMRRFLVFTLVLTACFALPLQALLRLAMHSELYSLIPVIPAISVYFVWIRRREVQSVSSGFNVAALLMAMIGVAALAVSFLLHPAPKSAEAVDPLSARILAYCCFLVAGGFVCFGTAVMRLMAFPAAMLAFFVPFPGFVVNGLESFFQHASADTAALLIRLTGTPMLRHGMIFELPRMTISVAPECSGIRSSLVLFITSLLAGQIFLHRPLHRWVIALIVIPLGILRNGIRILTIAILCVNVGPHMIDSAIHHHGGPVFFALSLAPFFLLLLILVRRERRQSGAAVAPSVSGPINDEVKICEPAARQREK